MKREIPRGKTANTPSVCSGRPLVLLRWRVRLVLLSHHCSLGDSGPVAEITSDFILVVAPLWILRGVRVSSGLRIRLIAIFSCSIMTTIVGVVHAVFVLKMPGALEAIMGERLHRSSASAQQPTGQPHRRGWSWKYELPRPPTSSPLPLAFFTDSDSSSIPLWSLSFRCRRELCRTQCLQPSSRDPRPRCQGT